MHIIHLHKNETADSRGTSSVSFMKYCPGYLKPHRVMKELFLFPVHIRQPKEAHS